MRGTRCNGQRWPVGGEFLFTVANIYGSWQVIGWRRVFDPVGEGHTTFPRFTKAARSCGVEADTRATWLALDPEGAARCAEGECRG